MPRMSHIWAYVADCQTYMRIAHKSRICVREPLPSAVGRSRGVEDWWEWIIMHVINACRCKYACFFDTLYHYALMKKVETQNFASHKEVVQFSRVIIYMINSAILARETPGMKIWRAITSNINWTVEDGRRKILRLYWACAVIKYWWKLYIIMRWRQK